MNMTRSLLARLFASLTITAIVGACEGSRPLAPTAESAGGTWQSSNGVTGSSERWVLTVTDGVVTGNGDWSGGIGCPGSVKLAGSLKIAGVARGDSLHLSVSYDVDCPEGRLVFRTGDIINAGLSSPRDLMGTRVIRASDIDILIHPVHFEKVDQ
jgi:hypothetical protein